MKPLQPFTRLRQGLMMPLMGLGVVVCALLLPVFSATAAREKEISPVQAIAQASEPGFQSAASRAKASAMPKRPRARNVIVFVGDGMGVATVTAARIFAGQRLGQDGESHELTLDTFPHTALSRTYSADFQVPDSAATATAMMTGVKTRSGVLGLRPGAVLGQCASASGQRSDTLFELAEAHGMATGIVTTTRITHATPAATYAHTPHRDWENDAQVARAQAGGDCPDIARQLVEWQAGDGFEVILGGGLANFTSTSGARMDKRDLIDEWSRTPGRAFVRNSGELTRAVAGDSRQIMGLFAPSHMSYEGDRPKGEAGEPALPDMTRAAIRQLQKTTKGGKQGYVLLVEGGRIDHAHHEGKAGRALLETVMLDEAVKVALDMTDRADTLIIVTADHSHTLTISGYAPRNAPILGLAGSEEGPANGKDGRPYTTLGYANGPGSVFAPGADPDPADGRRPDLSGIDVDHPDFRQPSLVPLDSETHGGEDVAIYAFGPNDGAFSGTLEQNVIFHNIVAALKWK